MVVVCKCATNGRGFEDANLSAAGRRKRKSRRLRELQNEIGWLDADLEAARAVPADHVLPGLLDQHDLPHHSASMPPLANGFHPHAHPALSAPMHEDHPAAPSGAAMSQHDAPHASCNGAPWQGPSRAANGQPHSHAAVARSGVPTAAASGVAAAAAATAVASGGPAGRLSPHQPDGIVLSRHRQQQQQQQRRRVQASPFAAAHACSPTHAEGGEHPKSGSPGGIPNSMALIPGLSLATELSLPEGLPLSAYPVPAGPVS